MLNRGDTALLIVDIQEKLFSKMVDHERLLEKTIILAKSCDILNIPITLSEQYPQGLGHTVAQLSSLLASLQNPISIFSKNHFSCFQDPPIRQHILKQNKKNWIVCGIESHICISLTARQMAEHGLSITVPADATSSRNQFEQSISWQKMRDHGIDISTTESIIFELLEDAKDPSFKKISALIK